MKLSEKQRLQEEKDSISAILKSVFGTLAGLIPLTAASINVYKHFKEKWAAKETPKADDCHAKVHAETPKQEDEENSQVVELIKNKEGIVQIEPTG